MTALEGKTAERSSKFAALGIRNVRVKKMLPGIDPVYIHYGESLAETEIIIDTTWLETASDSVVEDELHTAAAAIPAHFQKVEQAKAQQAQTKKYWADRKGRSGRRGRSSSSSGDSDLYTATAVNAAVASSASCG